MPEMQKLKIYTRENKAIHSIVNMAYIHIIQRKPNGTLTYAMLANSKNKTKMCVYYTFDAIWRILGIYRYNEISTKKIIRIYAFRIFLNTFTT